MTPQQKAAQLAAKIKKEVERSAAKGLNAARIFLTSRVKETLSVPAPRRAVKSLGGAVYYVATVRATPGAPPRKLSGKLRSSVTSHMETPYRAVIGANARGRPTKKYPKGFPYPKYHEVKQPEFKASGRHKYIAPTAHRYKKELATIVGQQVKLALSAGR